MNPEVTSIENNAAAPLAAKAKAGRSKRPATAPAKADVTPQPAKEVAPAKRKGKAADAATKAAPAKKAAKASPEATVAAGEKSPKVKKAGVAKRKPAEAKPVKPAKAKPTAAGSGSDSAATEKTAGDAARVEKPRKSKLVRDSFTMPKLEYDALGELKRRALQFGHEVKKSELLRAGLVALKSMPHDALQALLGQVPRIKTGRPKKGK
jgi:hypothetical protein